MDLIATYANGISELTGFSHSDEQPPLIVDVIVNPHAGFFKRQSTLARLITELEQKLDDLRRKSPRRKVEVNTVHFTEHPGHARLIADGIINAEARTTSGIERLLIGCGGDGTSNEICTSLVDADVKVLDRMKLLRLPLGTGNDVADAPTFADAYDLILGPQRGVKTGALHVTCADALPRYSFNVGSIGLDAFVVALTNRFKRVIPGDAYKFMVDIGTLFYERKTRPTHIDIRIHNEDGTVKLDPFVPSLVAVGIGGKRTYGGHVPVLPGRENVCIIDAMTLFEKLESKKLLYKGRHGELAKVRFFNASQIDFDYEGLMPMQLDGEFRWLHTEDFPLRIKVLPPRINVLRYQNA